MLIMYLELEFMILHKWFHENHMVLNTGKLHQIVIGINNLSLKINLKNKKITSSNEEKLLGILLDSKLIFVDKEGQELRSLARINNYFTQDQEIVLLNSMTKYQFSYYPLIINQYLLTALASDLQ